MDKPSLLETSRASVPFVLLSTGALFEVLSDCFVTLSTSSIERCVFCSDWRTRRGAADAAMEPTRVTLNPLAGAGKSSNPALVSLETSTHSAQNSSLFQKFLDAAKSARRRTFPYSREDGSMPLSTKVSTDTALWHSSLSLSLIAFLPLFITLLCTVVVS